MKDMPKGTSVKVGVAPLRARLPANHYQDDPRRGSGRGDAHGRSRRHALQPYGHRTSYRGLNVACDRLPSQSGVKFHPSQRATAHHYHHGRTRRCCTLTTGCEGLALRPGPARIAFAGTAGYRWAELPATIARRHDRQEIHTFWALYRDLRTISAQLHLVVTIRSVIARCGSLIRSMPGISGGR